MREGAILAITEFVRMLITVDAAYVVNPDDPSAIKFIATLKHRLALANRKGSASLLARADAQELSKPTKHLTAWGKGRHAGQKQKQQLQQQQQPVAAKGQDLQGKQQHHDHRHHHLPPLHHLHPHDKALPTHSKEGFPKPHPEHQHHYHYLPKPHTPVQAYQTAQQLPFELRVLELCLYEVRVL